MNTTEDTSISITGITLPTIAIWLLDPGGCVPCACFVWYQVVRPISTRSTRYGKALRSPNRLMASAGEVAIFIPRKLVWPVWMAARMPLAAGISNVNLNRSWAAAYHPAPLLDYLRVTPTGPMLPLVFTTTTIGRTNPVSKSAQLMHPPRDTVFMDCSSGDVSFVNVRAG